VSRFRGLSFQVNRFQECRQLTRCQIAPGADRQTGKTERSHTHPPQSLDRNADRVHDVAYQMVRPFMDHHLQDESLRRLTKDPKLLRNHAVPVDHDPVADPLQHRIGRTR
jgi:hypothetical protein